jgi:Family of unknown function (DUF6498)
MTTWKDILKRKLSQSDWLMIIANLVPVYGVWILHWSAKDVFLVYCFETIIIGFFTILKMSITGFIKRSDDWTNGGTTTKQPALLFILFFIVHYGMFVSIQMGLFFSISGIGNEIHLSFSNFFYKWPQLFNKEVMMMLGIFIVSYAFRNLTEFILSGEYRTISMGYLLFQPYGRIFIQQFTVIIGSIFLSFGAGKIFILVFALIIIYFEVFIDLDGLIRKTAKGELKSTEDQL